MMEWPSRRMRFAQRQIGRFRSLDAAVPLATVEQFRKVSGRARNGTTGYFGVNREPNRVDERWAGAEASCCGVNLAVAGLGVRGCGIFSAGCEPCPFAVCVGDGVTDALRTFPGSKTWKVGTEVSG